MNDKIEIKHITEAITETLEIFSSSQNIIVTSHLNPDGDAIGSSLALYHYGIQKNKNIEIILFSPVPDFMKFLPDSELIQKYDSSSSMEQKILNADAIFVLDLNDPTRLRTMQDPIIRSKARKCVIDHHISPCPFADVYIVEIESSSTGELIYKTLKSDPEFKLTTEISQCIYTAIMTDTGNFRFPATDKEVFAIASDLVSVGAKPDIIYDEVYNTMPSRAAKLLGRGFAAMEYFMDDRLAVMTLNRSDFEETGAIDEDVENFAEQLLCTRGTVVGILLTEQGTNNEIRISFRSKRKFNVRDLALKFGGGGHLQAAGARVNNIPMNILKSQLLEEAFKLFDN